MFQRFMDRIFAPLKRKYPGVIFCYMDDILIATGEDLELHQHIVHGVLDLLKQESLFCKISKCQFEQRSITYLGIVVKAGTIRIDPTKINGLLSWPRKLTIVKQLCFTLGVYGYHCVFVTAPRGCVADKHLSCLLDDLGNCRGVAQVLGTSQSD